MQEKSELREVSDATNDTTYGLEIDSDSGATAATGATAVVVQVENTHVQTVNVINDDDIPNYIVEYLSEDDTEEVPPKKPRIRIRCQRKGDKSGPVTKKSTTSEPAVVETNTAPTGPTFMCNICGNTYLERNRLTSHMRNHVDNKPHECEICHKRFRQTPQLARHMNSHTGNRPYKCKHCKASFADPSTCIKHQRIHTNERPYKCTVCDKAFSYSNVLKVHMKVHSDEEPSQPEDGK